jgi:hypothetical protein
VFIYIQPLLSIRSDLVPRLPEDAQGYSAQAVSYLATPEGNRVYGRYLGPFGSGELRLFPGVAAVTLALGAFARPRRTAVMYLVVLAIAVLGSLGPNAPLFGLMRGAVELVTMLRVPARFFAVALCALAALSAIGTASFLATLKGPRARLLGASVIAAVMLIEYSTALGLQQVRTEPAPVHRWLARQPPGPVVEFPMPRAARLPGPEPERQYLSIFHWQPLMNGYSGYYPRSYVQLLEHVSPFPRGGWLEIVLNRGARYIVLHEREIPRPDLREALRRLEANRSLQLIAHFTDLHDPVFVYQRVPPLATGAAAVR